MRHVTDSDGRQPYATSIHDAIHKNAYYNKLNHSKKVNCCFAIILLYVMIITLILMIIINSISKKKKER